MCNFLHSEAIAKPQRASGACDPEARASMAPAACNAGRRGLRGSASRPSRPREGRARAEAPPTRGAAGGLSVGGLDGRTGGLQSLRLRGGGSSSAARLLGPERPGGAGASEAAAALLRARWQKFEQ